MRRAFTLLEMLVTVALAAVVASVAAVSFAGTHRAARSADVADQVAHYDRLAREWSRRFGRPGQLAFDLDQGVMARGPASENAGKDENPPAELRLPGGFHIARVVSSRVSASSGRVSLPCSTRGQTPSYAVSISGPKSEVQWIIVAGLTGNVRPAQDETEVEDIFKTMAGSPGDDAR
jgi:prepilin-type N-terminal cleavage/methylation domain-containing protein